MQKISLGTDYITYCYALCAGDDDFLLQGTDTISFYPGSRVGSIQCITVQLVNRTNNNNVKSFSFLLTSEDPSIKITQGFDLLTIKILYTSLQGM